jgi:pimeloyl-ACP methyl ester carboxylesterase
MTPRFKIVPALMAVAALGACSDSYFMSPDPPLFKKATGPTHLEGRIGPGSLYELFLPAVWNGDLVIYSHGYVAPDEPIALPEVDPLPELLTGYGFGVAYSSFSENGYAIKDAVQRTRQLRAVFAAQFGMPERTLLVGHSEGAVIALMLAEKNPGLFDGALPMCGLVGGAQLQLEYLLNMRVLFDYYFPTVIPGTPFDIPEGLDYWSDVVPAMGAALMGNPLAAADMANVTQIQGQYLDMSEFAQSLVSALYYNVVGTEDMLRHTHGHIPAGNMYTYYTGSFDDATLNAGVQRFEATPDAGAYLEHWYQPTGKLSIPAITLHNTRDGAVPFFHEIAYAQLALAEGGSEMLVQRAVDDFGHCAFSVEEQLGAFLDLVAWVETGSKPMQ